MTLQELIKVSQNKKQKINILSLEDVAKMIHDRKMEIHYNHLNGKPNGKSFFYLIDYYKVSYYELEEYITPDQFLMIKIGMIEVTQDLWDRLLDCILFR